jgi:hypothetical protein
MPSTLDRRPSGDDNSNDPRRLQFGAILEKIRRGGSDALSQQERLIVVELFRAAAITKDPRCLKLRDEVSAAHLEYCFRLPTKQTPHDH